MATKVRYRKNGKIYLLVGVGFGAYRATRPSVFLGNLVPTEEEGEMTMVAVCDAKGTIRWAHSGDIEVVEIDGQTPEQLLQ